MKHILVARLILVILLLPLSHAALAQKLEENTDRHGGDYRDFDLPSPDPMLCHKACVDDHQCMAFTYLKPDTGPGSPQVAHCWLKDGVPDAKKDPKFVSGVVRTKPYVPPEKPRPPGTPGEWKLVETASGGLAGRHSTLTITSDGHFTSNKWGKHEDGTVPAATLAKLNQAILGAKPAAWKEDYSPSERCCDLVFESLHLEVCGADGKWRTYGTAWVFYQNMPADLEAIVRAIPS